MAIKDWRPVKTVNIAKFENKKNGYTLTVGEMLYKRQYSYNISLWTGKDLKFITNRVQKQNALKAAKEYMLKH